MSGPLFSHSSIGNVRLKNRMVVAPMTRTSARPSGEVTQQMVEYYREYAKGNFSLIITEGTYTDEQYSQGYFNQPGIATRSQVEAWKNLTRSVHAEGARIFIQLMHAGALTQGNRFMQDTVAPSSVQPRGEQLTIYGGEGPYRRSREITRQEMDVVVEGFVRSAISSVEAGFDGIELHGANGYLLDEFLTTYTNERTDEFGGSAANRVRFPALVLAAVKASVPSDLPVGIRISQGKVNDGHHQWPNGPQDAPVIFRKLRKAGADFIHITEYNALLPAFGGPTLVELAKQHSGLPVIANGQLEQPKMGEHMLSIGADLIALGKGALANMDWPLRVEKGELLNSFDPNMLQPRANLETSALWRKEKSPDSSVSYEF